MIADNPHHSRRWTILAILAIAQLMVVLDATIVNIALPSAQRALHFANTERQWIVTAYSLGFGSLLLLGGRISDLFGRKWTFIAGLANSVGTVQLDACVMDGKTLACGAVAGLENIRHPAALARRVMENIGGLLKAERTVFFTVPRRVAKSNPR